MRTLGIVGGIAPPSTIEYYRSIVEIHRSLAGTPPRVLINSVDGDEVLGHLAAGRHSELVTTLYNALVQLAAGGAQVAILASSSVHVCYDELRRASPLPLIGIMDATTVAVVDFHRVGLLATRFTVQADLFGAALAERGIAVVAPTAHEQQVIDRIYFDELVAGQLRPQSRARLLAIGARLRDEDNVEAILLGGTELPLLISSSGQDGLAYLDTARIHAEAAVKAMLEPAS